MKKALTALALSLFMFLSLVELVYVNVYMNLSSHKYETAELSLSKFDLFISSPYTILLIVIVAILITAAYRKLRYG